MLDLPDRAELLRRGSLKWNGQINPKTGQAADGAWVAEMDFGTPPAVKKTLIQAVEDGVLGYMPRGLVPAALDALRTFYQNRTGMSLSPEHVGLLPDVLSALHALLDLLAKPGAPVVVPTPAYMPFLTIPPSHQHPVIEVPSYQDEKGVWRLDFPALKNACQSGGVLIVCNPWNPVGRALDATELRQLAEIAQEKDTWIFNDEIHFPLVFPGVTHTPLLQVAPEVASRTVTALAASKGWNVAGLKCAQWVITEDGLLSRWRETGEKLGREATPLGVRAARAAYQEDTAWLDEVRTYLAQNASVIEKLVSQHLPALKVSKPEATYLSWWDCDALNLTEAPAKICLEGANVAVNDGKTLGAGLSQCLRFNFATPRPVLEELTERALIALKNRSGN